MVWRIGYRLLLMRQELRQSAQESRFWEGLRFGSWGVFHNARDSRPDIYGFVVRLSGLPIGSRAAYNYPR